MKAALGKLAALGRRTLRPRRFQAYCVGTAKSGTASIAEIFRPHYRAAHEADSELLIERILSRGEGEDRLGPEVLRERDRRLWLELDSSQLNLFLVEDLLGEFPAARFLLTIRDPLSWTDSFINHQLSRPASGAWRRFREYRFRRGPLEHPAQERVLREHGLYTLEGYLSYWSWHNQRALARIPAERLLVLRTGEIGESIPRIAQFLQIPDRSLSPEKAHANRARARLGILSQMPEDYLAGKVREHCGTLIEGFFPEQCSW